MPPVEPRQLVSRPASPTLVNDSSSLVNGGAVLAAALQKKMNRKRKANSLENDVRYITLYYILLHISKEAVHYSHKIKNTGNAST